MRSYDNTQSVQPGAHLLSAHKGKGHQFDWVIVLGLEKGHLPGRQANTADALREEEQVLLVMLSRARHGVVATRRSFAPGPEGQPWQQRPSRWWPLLESINQPDAETALEHIAVLTLLS